MADRGDRIEWRDEQLTQPEQRKSSVWKWILGGCLGVTVLGVIAISIGVWYVMKHGMITDPARLRTLSAEVVPFPVPARFAAKFGTAMLGFRMVIFEGQAGAEEMLMAFDVPAEGMNREQLQQQMREKADQKGGRRGGQFKVAERREARFRMLGEELPATVEVGEGEPGKRQASYTIMRIQGQRALLVIFAGADSAVNDASFQAILDGSAAPAAAAPTADGAAGQPEAPAPAGQ